MSDERRAETEHLIAFELDRPEQPEPDVLGGQHE
jgi:hypothetical protein